MAEVDTQLSLDVYGFLLKGVQIRTRSDILNYIHNLTNGYYTGDEIREAIQYLKENGLVTEVLTNTYQATDIRRIVGKSRLV